MLTLCWTPESCHIRATTVGQTRPRPVPLSQAEMAVDLPERTKHLMGVGGDGPFPS